jgi:hypothetical protein
MGRLISYTNVLLLKFAFVAPPLFDTKLLGRCAVVLHTAHDAVCSACWLLARAPPPPFYSITGLGNELVTGGKNVQDHGNSHQAGTSSKVPLKSAA